MADVIGFYLNAPSKVVELETMEISHPSFSQVYRVVRNAVSGLTVTLETSAAVPFTYYPVKITREQVTTTLDTPLQISFGDLGMILPQEIDRVRAADTFMIKPTVIYRTYRSDDLTQPLTGPLIYQLQTVAHKKEGATLNVQAPMLNLSKTGEVYALNRFTALRSV